MRLYTTQEAAGVTGLTVRALRKRIERGQLRAVQNGRYWRIPRSELARVGLLPPEGPRGEETQGLEPEPTDAVVLLAALEREREKTRQLTQQLARLRPLTAEVERMTGELHRVRAEARAAEARALAEASYAAKLRARGTKGTVAAAATVLACTSARVAWSRIAKT